MYATQHIVAYLLVRHFNDNTLHKTKRKHILKKPSAFNMIKDQAILVCTIQSAL